MELSVIQPAGIANAGKPGALKSRNSVIQHPQDPSILLPCRFDSHCGCRYVGKRMSGDLMLKDVRTGSSQSIDKKISRLL